MACVNQCRLWDMCAVLAGLNAEVALLWVHLGIWYGAAVWCSCYVCTLHHLDLSDTMVTEDTHKHMHTLTHAPTHTHSVYA